MIMTHDDSRDDHSRNPVTPLKTNVTMEKQPYEDVYPI